MPASRDLPGSRARDAIDTSRRLERRNYAGDIFPADEPIRRSAAGCRVLQSWCANLNPNRRRQGGSGSVEHYNITLAMQQNTERLVATCFPACEVLLNTPQVQELIKKGDVVGVKETLVRSSEKGMQSFDISLYQLYLEGKMTLEEALANGDSRTDLEAKINFG